MPNFHMRRPPWAVYGESQRASPGRRLPRHRRHLAHSLAVRSGIPFPHHRRGHVGPRGLSRGNRLLAARRFESPAGPWGSLVWARGPRVIRPTGNPTSLGCWRLRFKSGRTHLTSGSKPISISPPIPNRWFESVRRGDEGPSTRFSGTTQRSTDGTGI